MPCAKGVLRHAHNPIGMPCKLNTENYTRGNIIQRATFANESVCFVHIDVLVLLVASELHPKFGYDILV